MLGIEVKGVLVRIDSQSQIPLDSRLVLAPPGILTQLNVSLTQRQVGGWTPPGGLQGPGGC